MRTKIIILLLTSISTFIYGQTRNVVFVHGVNDKDAWDQTESLYVNKYDINAYAPNYNSNTSITNIAKYNSTLSTAYRKPNNVVVAHSMGGLVTRERIRLSSSGYSNDISTLITIGTPHYGAKIAESVTNGDAADLFALWIEDLALGWSSYGYYFGNEIARRIIYNDNYGVGRIEDYFNTVYGGVQSLNDMKPSSSFLNTLNANPSNSLPPKTYAIYGVEGNNTAWRLADAYTTQDNVESGVGQYWHYYFTYLYFYYSNYYFNLAWNYLYYYCYTWNWQYLFMASYYWHLSDTFYWGYYCLSYQHQIDWDYMLTGAYLGPNSWFSSDGIVPSYSQAPDFIPSYRKYFALNVNHLEELNHSESREQIETAMKKAGIKRK